MGGLQRYWVGRAAEVLEGCRGTGLQRYWGGRAAEVLGCPAGAAEVLGCPAGAMVRVKVVSPLQAELKVLMDMASPSFTFARDLLRHNLVG